LTRENLAMPIAAAKSFGLLNTSAPAVSWRYKGYPCVR